MKVKLPLVRRDLLRQHIELKYDYIARLSFRSTTHALRLKHVPLYCMFTSMCAYVCVCLRMYLHPSLALQEIVLLNLPLSCVQKAGCSFQKIGQWLSMRPDVCPPDFIAALGKLRTSTPSHSFEATEAAVRVAFQCERLSDIFDEFDHEPVASGSVAQVHRWVSCTWAQREGGSQGLKRHLASAHAF